MRHEMTRDMEFAGVKLDAAKNQSAAGGMQMDIAAADSKVKVRAHAAWGALVCLSSVSVVGITLTSSSPAG